jgi:hypothetical protein
MTRPMTPRLRAALDGLTASQRRTLTMIAGESEHGWLRDLLLGLVAEVVTAEAHETTILHAHEMDRLADVDKDAEGAVWPTEPEDRSKGEPWWPEGRPGDAGAVD